MELWEELNLKMKQLDLSLKSLRENGIKYAEAEKSYKMLLNKKVLELDAKGMKSTVINLTIYGYDEVAQARFNRDTCQVIYNANLESINVLKLEIKVIQNQLSTEMNNA